jgi:3-oxoacyl-[acyl-carrier protein] reductase
MLYTVDLQLEGKSVLVTGGSKGIGLACTCIFAQEGCRVHLASRDRERLEQARKQLQGAASIHPGCRPRRSFGRAPARRHPGRQLESVDDAKWRHAWELKVFGYINLTRALFGRMKTRRSGVIVNVFGLAAEHPSPEYICGATANAGLAAFTKALGKPRAGRRRRHVQPDDRTRAGRRYGGVPRLATRGPAFRRRS